MWTLACQCLGVASLVCAPGIPTWLSLTAESEGEGRGFSVPPGSQRPGVRASFVQIMVQFYFDVILFKLQETILRKQQKNKKKP